MSGGDLQERADLVAGPADVAQLAQALPHARSEVSHVAVHAEGEDPFESHDTRWTPGWRESLARKSPTVEASSSSAHGHRVRSAVVIRVRATSSAVSPLPVYSASKLSKPARTHRVRGLVERDVGSQDPLVVEARGEVAQAAPPVFLLARDGPADEVRVQGRHREQHRGDVPHRGEDLHPRAEATAQVLARIGMGHRLGQAGEPRALPEVVGQGVEEAGPRAEDEVDDRPGDPGAPGDALDADRRARRLPQVLFEGGEDVATGLLRPLGPQELLTRPDGVPAALRTAADGRAPVAAAA